MKYNYLKFILRKIRFIFVNKFEVFYFRICFKNKYWGYVDMSMKFKYLLFDFEIDNLFICKEVIKI